jgi:hypothetical protein
MIDTARTVVLGANLDAGILKADSHLVPTVLKSNKSSGSSNKLNGDPYVKHRPLY